MSRSLPSFRDPPLAEVVIGFTFSTPSPLLSPHLSDYWRTVDDRFPKFQQLDPLRTQVERFGQKVRSVSHQEIKVQVGGGVLTPRLWLISEEENELIQVQPDMFLRNWRRYQSPDTDYPRFGVVCPRFLDEFQNFENHIEGAGLGPLKIEQAEVTYVNHISPPTGDDEVELSEIIRHWNPTKDGIGNLENVDVTFTKLIQNHTEEPIGRLHVRMRTGWQDGAPLLALTLTARGFTATINDFLEIAHQEIVLGFDSITTSKMHKVWGKEDE